MKTITRRFTEIAFSFAVILCLFGMLLSGCSSTPSRGPTPRMTELDRAVKAMDRGEYEDAGGLLDRMLARDEDEVSD